MADTEDLGRVGSVACSAVLDTHWRRASVDLLLMPEQAVEGDARLLASVEGSNRRTPYEVIPVRDDAENRSWLTVIPFRGGEESMVRSLDAALAEAATRRVPYAVTGLVVPVSMSIKDLSAVRRFVVHHQELTGFVLFCTDALLFRRIVFGWEVAGQRRPQITDDAESVLREASLLADVVEDGVLAVACSSNRTGAELLARLDLVEPLPLGDPRVRQKARRVADRPTARGALADQRVAELVARAEDFAAAVGHRTVDVPHLLGAIAVSGPPPSLTGKRAVTAERLRECLREAVATTLPGEEDETWTAALGIIELAGGVSPELVDPSVGIPLGEDRLGFANYVAMLATVVARKDTPLPLSVGLFGEWGSGKSYFMALLRGEINVLTQSGNPAYHRDVVQIGFNAWHYSDTDLWASLGNTIFERLAGSQETVEERRAEVSRELAEHNRRRHQLDAATAAAEEQAAKLRKRIEDSRRSARVSLRQAATASAPVLEEVWSRLGITDVLAQGEVVVAEARGVRTELAAWRRMVASRGWLASAALLLVLVPVLLTVVDWSSVGDLTAAAAAAVASLGLVATGLRRASSTLRMLSDTAERIRDDQLREPIEELRRAEAEQLVLQAQLNEVVARVGELGREMAGMSPGQRLYGFVSERAASEDYRARLGLVSTVRHDLQRLADLMARWRDHGGPGPRPIDRIVLYIDDLDRCSPRQVVDVLQAVHLLLALDLFVVVLGVDPRILVRSLEREMPGTFGEATPLDYLEKIFNIPFALPAMEPAGFDALIRSLVPVESSGVIADGNVQRPAGENWASVPEPGVQAEEGSEVAAMRSGSLIRSVPRALTDAERDMLASVAPLVRSPRQAKRLVNLYRMIRATRNLGPASRFLGTADAPGDHQAVVVLLGLLTAQPDRFGALLDHLAGRPATDSWPKVAAELAQERDWRPIMDMLHGATERVALSDLTAFRHWAPHVERFSFVLSGAKP